MKKYIIFALAGVIGTLSCTAELQPDNAEVPAGGAQKTTVNLCITTAEPGTRTFMEEDGGQFVPMWHATDRLGVLFDSWNAGAGAADAVLANSSPDGRTATFEGTASVGEGVHTVYAFSPARAFYATEAGRILDLEIPCIQFPAATSFDPRADLLVGVPADVRVSGNSATVDKMHFRRIGAILEVKLADATTGSALSADNIKSVKLESGMAGAALTGVFRYDFAGADAAATQMTVSTPGVTADFTESPMPFPGSRVYLIVNPTTLRGGSRLTVTVLTDRHEVSKTVSLPSDLELPSSKVTTLTFNLTGDAATVFFQDSFDWIARYWDDMADGAADTFLYTTAHDRVLYNLDPVANGSTSTTAEPPYKQPNIWAWNPNTLGAAFTSLGYADRQQNEAAKVLYAQENYLKFGKTDRHNCLTLPALPVGGGSVNVDLSFDWSAQDAGKEFVVEVTGGGVCAGSGSAVSTPFSQSTTLKWERKTLALSGITASSRICIRPNLTNYAASGKYRWFIDNIRVSEHTGPVVAGNVIGRVLDSNGNPVAGVAVSDGIAVTSTGADGWYGLQSQKANGYVFISQPQGYEARLEGVFPQFWQALSGDVSVEERHDFTLTAVDNSQCVLLALGDLHLCNRNALYDLRQFRLQTDELKRQVLTLRSQGKKVYGLTLGDMTWDLYWDGSSGLAGCNFDLSSYKSEVNSDFAGLSFPVWHTIGNHDHDYRGTGDWDTVIPYKQVIGPTYYSFNVGGYHIISLDNVICENDGTVSGRSNHGGLTQEILDWISADLALTGASTPLIISMHEPMHVPSDPTGGYIYYTYVKKLTPLLGSRNVHMISGHTHCLSNVKVSSKLYEHNTGALCSTWWWTGRFSISSEASWGSGSSLSTIYNVGPDGSPSGYTVYDLSAGRMSWRYKAFSLDADRQFKTYDRNQFVLTAANWCPAATAARKKEFEELTAKGDGTYSYAVAAGTSGVPANLVYINVWDYDPSFKITVTENGKSLTVTKLTDAYDPMHMVAYSAVRYQNGSAATAAFNSIATQHIFRVQASEANSTLVVTVTDRFGNVSTQTMTRPKAFTVGWD